jgi:hypothetical protein
MEEVVQQRVRVHWQEYRTWEAEQSNALQELALQALRR